MGHELLDALLRGALVKILRAALAEKKKGKDLSALKAACEACIGTLPGMRVSSGRICMIRCEELAYFMISTLTSDLWDILHVIHGPSPHTRVQRWIQRDCCDTSNFIRECGSARGRWGTSDVGSCLAGGGRSESVRMFPAFQGKNGDSAHAEQLKYCSGRRLDVHMCHVFCTSAPACREYAGKCPHHDIFLIWRGNDVAFPFNLRLITNFCSPACHRQPGAKGRRRSVGGPA
jgi:hypothetical protein